VHEAVCSEPFAGRAVLFPFGIRLAVFAPLRILKAGESLSPSFRDAKKKELRI